MSYTLIARIALPFAVALLSLKVAEAQEVDDADRQALAEIIQSVERGWQQADGAPFRAHFLDFEGARYIESGGQNKGLADLIENHVEPEGDALSSFELRFSNIESHVESGLAWVVFDVELQATVNRTGEQIHRNGYSTYIFRRVGPDWKVVHTHNSTRPVKKE